MAAHLSSRPASSWLRGWSELFYHGNHTLCPGVDNPALALSEPQRSAPQGRPRFTVSHKETQSSERHPTLGLQGPVLSSVHTKNEGKKTLGSISTVQPGVIEFSYCTEQVTEWCCSKRSQRSGSKCWLHPCHRNVACSSPHQSVEPLYFPLEQIVPLISNITGGNH